jgi:hypothetical protein
MAIRRDLVEAGIGFGIFDFDAHAPSNGENKSVQGVVQWIFVFAQQFISHLSRDSFHPAAFICADLPRLLFS